VAEILEETSSSEYAIDHRLSRLKWKPRRAAIWLCDRYQEGSGLAPLEALEQDEISTLLGHPVDFIAQHALPTSFLATALCDLAAFVDGGLYSDVVNDVKASRIAMRYLTGCKFCELL
jgi:hypothetical protein